MFKQQEMNFMWNSNAAWDGGVFYRTLGRWTDRSVPKTKDGNLWNHYHPEHQKRDEEECRLFELTKNLPNKGVGRLVYNKYEKNMKSTNLDILSEEGEVYPETYWLITRAWNDWQTPVKDLQTSQIHTGNFGYAYGILFHKGETDGLEREFNQQNEAGWYVVPRFSEEKLLSQEYEKEVLYRVEKNIEIPPVLKGREKLAYFKKYNEAKVPKLTLEKY